LVDISLVHDDPATAQEAQFSLPYAAACAARHGGLGLEHLTASALADPGIRALMRKVRKVVDADLSSDTMRAAAPESARVVVRLDDGRTREGFCPVACGMPSRPLSDAALMAKVNACMMFAHGRAADTSAPCRRLLSLGEAGAKHLSGSLPIIWPSARKDDPIPVSDRLARGLRHECRRSGARAE
jgi:2-methylcitrate dehydratase PrpD